MGFSALALSNSSVNSLSGVHKVVDVVLEVGIIEIIVLDKEPLSVIADMVIVILFLNSDTVITGIILVSILFFILLKSSSMFCYVFYY